MSLQEIYDFMDGQYENMVHLWKEIVLIESDSNNVEGVNMLASHMDTYLLAMGMETQKYTFPHAGASVAAWTKERELKPIVLMAHMDTAYPKGVFGANLWQRKLGVVYGGGVCEAKGGIVVAFIVAKALLQAGYKKRQIKILLSGDEEVAQSLSDGGSMKLYTDHIPGAAVAFSCDPAAPNGDVVLQRKGANFFKIKVHGASAHTAKDPLKGINAIREACKILERVESLSDYPEGAYCNCGKIKGGTAVNSVPDYCEITGLVRYPDEKVHTEIMDKIRAICAHPEDERVTVEVEENSYYPAMVCTEKTEELFGYYKKACQSLGYKAPQGLYSNEASAAAYATKEGVPAICGCGVRGAEVHTLKEWAYEASMIENAKKIVATILSLPDDF